MAAGQCTKVNPAARPEAVGLLGCGVMAGIGAAMFTGGVGPGDSVAVFGCGGVGCAAIAGAPDWPAPCTIIAVDLDPAKLTAATAFGATHTVDASSTDPVAAVQGFTNGFGADVCIEAVGHPKVMEQAFFARDLAGTLVQVGVPTPDMRIDLPMIEFFGRGGQLKPSWYGDCLPSPRTSRSCWSTSTSTGGSTSTCSSARPSASMRWNMAFFTVRAAAKSCARSSKPLFVLTSTRLCRPPCDSGTGIDTGDYR